VIGHNRVWQPQTGAWVFQGADAKPADRDTLLARMRDHIHTVVGRYKGKIHGWDVVNEAIDEDGSMRKSPWQCVRGASSGEGPAGAEAAHRRHRQPGALAARHASRRRPGVFCGGRVVTAATSLRCEPRSGASEERQQRVQWRG